MPIIAAQAADELLSISGIQASFVLVKVEGVVIKSITKAREAAGIVGKVLKGEHSRCGRAL